MIIPYPATTPQTQTNSFPRLCVFSPKLSRTVGCDCCCLVVHLTALEESQFLREGCYKGIQTLISLQRVVETVRQNDTNAKTTTTAYT